MNTKQMRYAVMLAETGSFSQLADKLKISQPALSKQILALEKELDVKLFDRSAIPITPTAAGAHFVAEAKELLFRQQQLLSSMEQFRLGDRGSLVIGATPFRSAYLLPEMLAQLRQKYPGVQVKVVEKNSALLRKDAAEGRFDFAVVNLPVDEAALECKLLEPDKVVLVVPNTLQQHLPGEPVAFADCAKMPFVTVSDRQEMRILFEKLCLRCGVSPTVAAEVVGLTTAWDMACAGVGATLLPLQFVRTKPQDKVTVLQLQDEVFLRQPAIAIRHGQHLTPYAQYAMELLQKLGTGREA